MGGCGHTSVRDAGGLLHEMKFLMLRLVFCCVSKAHTHTNTHPHARSPHAFVMQPIDLLLSARTQGGKSDAVAMECSHGAVTMATKLGKLVT